MSSSLAWAAPIANTATAPTQVVRRKLRIGILPATVPRVTDAIAQARAAGRHPFDGKSFRQRVTAQRRRRRNLALMPRLAYEDTSGFPRADVLEAGSRKKPIPATNRPQPSFWAFVERTGLDAAIRISTRRRISSVSCAR